MKKRNKLLLFGIIIFFILMISYNIYEKKVLDSEGVYSIARIVNVEGARSGKKVTISYLFRNKIIENSYIEDVTRISKNDIGKRYLIKFRREDADGDFDLFFDKTVPDSVQAAPSEGWEKLPIF